VTTAAILDPDVPARPEDPNWQAVSRFVSDLRNASRLATYADAVVDMFESGAWRRYTDATGRADEWRAAEFDYFLIACDANYTDVQKLLTWDRAKAADLAAAMESDERRRRRTLEDAAAAWHSPTGTTLVDLAERNGWTTPSGALRVPPAPARARARARHGVTMDEHARLNRKEQIAAKRRRELDQDVKALGETLSEVELRYVRDAITQTLAKRGRPKAVDLDQLGRDVIELGGDVEALAKRWNVTMGVAKKRIHRAAGT
jgi:hypothetical protein